MEECKTSDYKIQLGTLQQSQKQNKQQQNTYSASADHKMSVMRDGSQSSDELVVRNAKIVDEFASGEIPNE